MFTIKEIKLLRLRRSKATSPQALAAIDTDIGQKGHLWMETSYMYLLSE
jgi:hypothetical protein